MVCLSSQGKLFCISSLQMIIFKPQCDSSASPQCEEGWPGGHVWHAEGSGGFQELDQRGHGPCAGEDEGSLDWYIWIHGVRLVVVPCTC